MLRKDCSCVFILGVGNIKMHPRQMANTTPSSHAWHLAEFSLHVLCMLFPTWGCVINIVLKANFIWNIVKRPCWLRNWESYFISHLAQCPCLNASQFSYFSVSQAALPGHKRKCWLVGAFSQSKKLIATSPLSPKLQEVLMEELEQGFCECLTVLTGYFWSQSCRGDSGGSVRTCSYTITCV